MQIALFEPEIPHNTGALMRLCACWGVPLHLIEPLGFVLSDKHLKRSGLDYRDKATVTSHHSFDHFKQTQTQRRLILLDTKGPHNLYDFVFTSQDTLVMGRESTGFPDHIQGDYSLVIPMRADCRSLNLALAAAIAMGEYYRQCRHISH